MNTMPSIEELEKLARGATPGPWIRAEGDIRAAGHGLICRSYYGSPDGAGASNAAYIAACSPEVILRLCAAWRAAEAMLPAMAECQEIARRWEPDDSSGKERQWLVRGKDAAAALRAALGKEAGRG